MQLSYKQERRSPWQYYFVAAFPLFGIFGACSTHHENLPVKPQNETVEIKKTPESNQSVLLAKKKLEKNKRLQFETNAWLHLFGKMQEVSTYIVDEPVINDGDETERASAYTLCENNNQPTILVKRVFYEKNKPKHVAAILRHELVHAWFCQQGIRAGHDEQFQKKLKSIESAFKKKVAR